MSETRKSKSLGIILMILGVLVFLLAGGTIGYYTNEISKLKSLKKEADAAARQGSQISRTYAPDSALAQAGQAIVSHANQVNRSLQKAESDYEAYAPVCYIGLGVAVLLVVGGIMVNSGKQPTTEAPPETSPETP